MKKSELRKLVAKYKETKSKIKKSNDKKLQDKLDEIEHRYYHETGRSLKDDNYLFTIWPSLNSPLNVLPSARVKVPWP